MLSKVISEKLGIPEPAVQKGMSTLLQFLRGHLKGTDFEKFVALIPGASALPQTSAAQESGPLGGIMKLLSNIFGSQSADIAKVVGSLTKAGIKIEQVGPFVQEFLQGTKSAADANNAGELFASVTSVLQKLTKSSS